MKTEKLLGALGSIFIILSFIPYLGWLLAVVGLVFLLISLNAYSKSFGDSHIFNHFLIGFIVGLIGTAISLMFGMSSFFSLLAFMEHEKLAAFSLSGLFFAFIGYYISLIVANYFYRRSLVSLGKYTGEKLFNLAGNLLLLGAVLSIIIIGGIIGLIGWMLLAVAFFKLPEQG